MAIFVFQLFLPVVILIFQLWFLLLAEFCIPPDVDVGARVRCRAGRHRRRPDVDCRCRRRLEADFGATVNTEIDRLLSGDHDNGQPLADTVINAASSGCERSCRRACIRLAKCGLSAASAAPPNGPDVRPARRPSDGGAMTITPAMTAPAAATRRPVPTALGTGWSPSRPWSIRHRRVRLAVGRGSGPAVDPAHPGHRAGRAGHAPDFGCGLRRYLMEPNTPATRAAIALDDPGRAARLGAADRGRTVVRRAHRRSAAPCLSPSPTR